MLHNLTFKLHAGERVGILGRTGCGKSTLGMCFWGPNPGNIGLIMSDSSVVFPLCRTS